MQRKCHSEQSEPFHMLVLELLQKEEEKEGEKGPWRQVRGESLQESCVQFLLAPCRLLPSWELGHILYSKHSTKDFEYSVSLERLSNWVRKVLSSCPRYRRGTEALRCEVTLMADFLCRLDWAMGCPDIWLNIILGMSVRVFLDEIESVEGVKQIALPIVSGSHPMP